MKKQASNLEQTTMQDSIMDRVYGQVSDTEIAMRAYQIYQGRGSQDGADLDDWLQAERELSQQSSLGREASARGAA